MLEYWLVDPAGERPCGFLHVPGPAEPEDVVRGVRVAVAAIGAIAESLMVRGQDGGGVYVPDPRARFDKRERERDDVG